MYHTQDSTGAGMRDTSAQMELPLDPECDYRRGRDQGRKDCNWFSGEDKYAHAVQFAEQSAYHRGYCDGYEAKRREMHLAHAELERIRALGLDLLK